MLLAILTHRIMSLWLPLQGPEPRLSALTWLGHGCSRLGSGALDGHSLLHHDGAVLGRPTDPTCGHPHLRRLQGHRGVATGTALPLWP